MKKSHARHLCSLGLCLLGWLIHAPVASATSFAGNETRLAHPDGKVMVVSHRGCWRYAAENSLQGIDVCAAMGVDMVEIDVRKTRDGVLVLMHDDSVDRTTDGHGKVRDLSGSQVLALRQRTHGGGREPFIAGAHVPTLDQALDRAKGRVLVNLDVKDDDIYDEVISRVVAKGMARQVLIKRTLDTSHTALLRWAKQIPFSAVLPVRSGGPKASDLIRDCADIPLVAVELLLASNTDLDGVGDIVRSRHLHVWVNTLARDVASGRPMNMSGGHDDIAAMADPDDSWGWLLDRGVDMLQTDEPAAALAYLRKRGVHAD